MILCNPCGTENEIDSDRMLAGVAIGVAPRSTTPARVLVVAGSDSGGGAGIQADIRACMANRAFAATAISALTAQNSHGVHSVHVAPVESVEAQMAAVLDDIGTDAVKTGMLPSGEIVRKVAEVRPCPAGWQLMIYMTRLSIRFLFNLEVRQEAWFSRAVHVWSMACTAPEGRPCMQKITEHKEKCSKALPVVVDPVLVSTSGSSLSGDDAVEAMKTALLPVATVLTPNLDEASALLGVFHAHPHALPQFTVREGKHKRLRPSVPRSAATSLVAATDCFRSSARTSERMHAGDRKITTLQDMHAAARDLAELGAQSVLLKGGHLPPAPPAAPAAAGPSSSTEGASAIPVASAPISEAHAAAFTVTPPGVTKISVSLDAVAQPNASVIVDVLYDGTTGDTLDLPTPRVDTLNTHGTGCTLASALAARLAHGMSLVAAVTEAQQYVHACIADSVPLSLGSGPQGALDHGAGLCNAPSTSAGTREPPGVWGELVAPPVVVRPEQRNLDYAVYVVTDPAMNEAHNRSTGAAVAAAIKGGATVVQIRCVSDLYSVCLLEHRFPGQLCFHIGHARCRCLESHLHWCCAFGETRPQIPVHMLQQLQPSVADGGGDHVVLASS